MTTRPTHHRRQADRGRARHHHPPGVRDGRRRDPALLLPRAPVDRRQLPHVPRRGGRHPQAGRVVRHGRHRPAAQQGRRAAKVFTTSADGQEGARRRDGVPADQPSARLPDLRPGRRVRPAGPGDGLRLRRLALHREQARRRREVHRPADQDDHEPVHPLHALRPLHDRSGGRRGAGRDRPRRGHGDHHLPRSRHALGAVGQRERPVPGRRADAPALGVHRAPVGARARPNPSTSWMRSARPSASTRAGAK